MGKEKRMGALLISFFHNLFRKTRGSSDEEVFLGGEAYHPAQNRSLAHAPDKSDDSIFSCREIAYLRFMAQFENCE